MKIDEYKIINTKRFSLPFNSFITPKEFQTLYYPFLEEYKDYIYDIYFSVALPPFYNDAMGQSNQLTQQIMKNTLSVMLDIQKKLNITVSVTFNNIHVEPSLKNKEIFLKTLDFLYDRGIRSITIPHIHWMYDGQIKKLYPELLIKNTVLRKVNTPQMYVDYVKAGFNVVNIDRINLRDRDNLKRFKKAYLKYKIPISILVNESCRGGCPAMDEHYTLNCAKDSIPYFKQEISQNTCSVWRGQDSSYHLRVANMPIIKDDFKEFEEYIQIFKLHGRSEMSVLRNSIDIVKDYANNNEIIGKNWMKNYNYDEKKLKHWKEFTKNCKFECWDCKVCDDLTLSSKEMCF